MSSKHNIVSIEMKENLPMNRNACNWISALAVTFIAAFSLMAVSLFPAPAIAQDDDGNDTPSQIDVAIENLNILLGTSLTLDSFDRFEWEQQSFPDTSLGCVVTGQAYEPAAALGYSFLLTYNGLVYDYRVSEDESIVFLCDTYAAQTDSDADMDMSPDATQEPDMEATAIVEEECGTEYTIEAGDTLSAIAARCNTNIAALMTLNPAIPDRSLIFIGQTITIPETTAPQAVAVRYATVAPVNALSVYASGFPQGSTVEIGFGPDEDSIIAVATREVGRFGDLVTSVLLPTSLEVGATGVVSVTANGQAVFSEPFVVAEGQVNPNATPFPTQDPNTSTVQVFFVALDDAGQSGEAFGCEDSLVPVTVIVPADQDGFTAALNTLFSTNTRTYGESGLYNAFYQSNVTVDSASVADSVATINLSGTIRSGGVCDDPRIRTQIERTAQQFGATTVNINLNGQPY